jgi:hypothetical protein
MNRPWSAITAAIDVQTDAQTNGDASGCRRFDFRSYAGDGKSWSR